MELLWRFLLGGALVSLFALAGDVVRPKRIAGIFGGAPSVALAILALTVANSGPVTAALEARSMILSSLGFVLYVYIAQRPLSPGRWSPRCHRHLLREHLLELALSKCAICRRGDPRERLPCARRRLRILLKEGARTAYASGGWSSFPDPVALR